MTLIPCPRCSALGKPVLILGSLVVFWRIETGTGTVWWRDENHHEGEGCGYCGIPSARLLYEGWAQRKRGRARRAGRLCRTVMVRIKHETRRIQR